MGTHVRLGNSSPPPVSLVEQGAKQKFTKGLLIVLRKNNSPFHQLC